MSLRQRFLIVIVGLALAQGIYAEWQVRQLWLQKVALQEIVLAPSVPTMCKRLADKGL